MTPVIVFSTQQPGEKKSEKKIESPDAPPSPLVRFRAFTFNTGAGKKKKHLQSYCIHPYPWIGGEKKNTKREAKNIKKRRGKKKKKKTSASPSSQVCPWGDLWETIPLPGTLKKTYQETGCHQELPSVSQMISFNQPIFSEVFFGRVTLLIIFPETATSKQQHHGSKKTRFFKGDQNKKTNLEIKKMDFNQLQPTSNQLPTNFQPTSASARSPRAAGRPGGPRRLGAPGGRGRHLAPPVGLGEFVRPFGAWKMPKSHPKITGRTWSPSWNHLGWFEKKRIENIIFGLVFCQTLRKKARKTMGFVLKQHWFQTVKSTFPSCVATI